MDEKPIFLNEKSVPRSERGQNLRPEQFEALVGRTATPAPKPATPLNEWDVI